MARSRSNKRRNNTGRRSRNNRRQTPMLAVQKQILASNRAQETKAVPTIPDISALHIRRLKVHTIQSKISIGGATTEFGIFTFAISQFPDSSSLINIFDQYRFAQVVLDFYGEVDSDPIVTAIDYTDLDTPALLPDVLDKETAQINSGATASYFRRVLSPKYVINNGAADILATVSSAWIPTGDGTGAINNTVWFGLKWAFLNGTPTVGYSVIATLVLNLRDTT